MTRQQKIEQDSATPVDGLALLREPFPAHQISKLPKPTKAQTDAVRADFKKGIRCEICGGWHHPKVVHLDYVGHAALTDRLLDCDPLWNWEPVTTDEKGAPLLDANGGMWIRLTVCGVTRLGYGHPDGKKGGDAIKEVIGDALRNAAMRFGAALDLWHKGDLHGTGADEGAPEPETKADEGDSEPEFDAPGTRDRIKAAIGRSQNAKALEALWAHHATKDALDRLHPAMKAEVEKAHADRKAELEAPANADIGDDEIPY